MEGLLRSGHPDVAGLCLALSDWWAELRMIEQETINCPAGSRDEKAMMHGRKKAAGHKDRRQGRPLPHQLPRFAQPVDEQRGRDADDEEAGGHGYSVIGSRLGSSASVGTGTAIQYRRFFWKA